MTTYYDYKELREKALNGTQADVNALGDWFEKYGDRYWNGECYDADGFSLYPIYKEIAEDEFELTGYRID